MNNLREKEFEKFYKQYCINCDCAASKDEMRAAFYKGWDQATNNATRIAREYNSPTVAGRIGGE